MKNLVVVESPVKARTLNRFLGKDYLVLSSMGHVRDLPKSKLGVKIEKDKFIPEYVPVVQKTEMAKKIKQEAKKAKKIIIATDPDREGEAIAWHISEILECKDTKILERVTFHEITKSAIEKALAHPGKIDMQLVDAQQARRVLDRLVGYKLSPLLWRKIRRGLSAGRVQSVAVRLIVDREREIEKFVAEEYWDIAARLRRHLGGKKEGAPTFLAKLTNVNGEKATVKNSKQADGIASDLEKANYEVASTEKKEALRRPAPPFTTSTMQQKAAQVLRFSSKRTMRVAQSLYEKGLITYHRTDSFNLAKEAQTMIRQYINSTYGEKYLPAKPRFYKTKSKVAQEAHEAIRPTKINKESPDLARDEARLYELIFKRAVACQMATAVWDQTKVKVQATVEKNIYILTAEGKVMKFDGWLVVYGGIGTGVEERLPALKKSDDLDLIKVVSEQKFTKPSARYTEASLIKTLEEKGIGRPSTYASIISTIQWRQYVEKQEGKFQPTSLGLTVNDFLMDYFSQIMDYQFTARIEDDLDNIARGEKKWMSVVAEFYHPFAEKLEGVSQVAERVRVPAEATGEKCPKCQKGSLVIRVGKFGKFISCSRFPDCKYTAPFVFKLEGFKCEKCDGDVIIKKTKKGKQFYGCSNWPKCDWASWRKPK